MTRKPLILLLTLSTVFVLTHSLAESQTRNLSRMKRETDVTWNDKAEFKGQMTGAQVFWHGYLWAGWDSKHGLTAFDGKKTVRAGKTSDAYSSGAPTLYPTSSGMFAAVHSPQAVVTYQATRGEFVLGEKVIQKGSNASGFIYKNKDNVLSLEVMERPFTSTDPITGVTSKATATVTAATNNKYVYFLEWSPDGFQDFIPVQVVESLGTPYLPHQLCDCGVIRSPIQGHRNVRVVVYGEYTEGNPTFYYCLPEVDVHNWVPLFRVAGEGKGNWPASTQAIRHFHGEVWVPRLGEKEGRLFVMTGDNNEQSSILTCDDIADLCNNGSKWATRWGMNIGGPNRVEFLKHREGAHYCLTVGAQDSRTVEWVVDAQRRYAYYIPDQSSVMEGFPQGVNFLHRVDLRTRKVTILGDRLIGTGWTGCLAPDGTVLFSTESDFGEQGVKAYNGNCDEYVRIYGLRDDGSSLREVTKFRRKDYLNPTYPSNVALNKLTVAFGAIWGWDMQRNFEAGDVVGALARTQHVRQ